MTARTGSASGNGVRSGAQALMLLADPLNVFVLGSLTTGPKRQAELRHKSPSLAQSTLRAHLGDLERIGAVARCRRNAVHGSPEFGLAESGSELLVVASTLEDWLAGAEHPLTLGSDAAKAAIRALAEGWSNSMIRALAARPLSLTELDEVIAGFNYPSLGRRLTAMRLAGQVEATSRDSHGTPYAVTTWLRRGMAPLAAAARWEHRHLPPGASPIKRIDAEAALLLALPLVHLDHDLSGSCRLAVQLSDRGRHSLAGVVAGVRLGRIASCATRLEGYPDAWVCGPPSAWLAGLIDGDVDRLELGGDGTLARSLLEGLHRALFEVRAGQR
jgi:DNA-binding HxlR family transcriptional regulator